MDRILIDNINSVVQPDDTLYHLGDFCFPKKKVIWGLTARQYRERIKCKNIILIYGNHDPKLGSPTREQFCRIFNKTADILEIPLPSTHYIDKKKVPIVLCHYAMRTWVKSHYFSWNLCGHSHGNCKEALPSNFTGGTCLDVGVDVWNYFPINMDQISEVMKWKTQKIQENRNISQLDSLH